MCPVYALAFIRYRSSDLLSKCNKKCLRVCLFFFITSKDFISIENLDIAIKKNCIKPCL